MPVLSFKEMRRCAFRLEEDMDFLESAVTHAINYGGLSYPDREKLKGFRRVLDNAKSHLIDCALDLHETEHLDDVAVKDSEPNIKKDSSENLDVPHSDTENRPTSPHFVPTSPLYQPVGELTSPRYHQAGELNSPYNYQTEKSTSPPVNYNRNRIFGNSSSVKSISPPTYDKSKCTHRKPWAGEPFSRAAHYEPGYIPFGNTFGLQGLPTNLTSRDNFGFLANGAYDHDPIPADAPPFSPMALPFPLPQKSSRQSYKRKGVERPEMLSPEGGSRGRLGSPDRIYSHGFDPHGFDSHGYKRSHPNVPPPILGPKYKRSRLA